MQYPIDEQDQKDLLALMEAHIAEQGMSITQAAIAVRKRYELPLEAAVTLTVLYMREARAQSKLKGLRL